MSDMGLSDVVTNFQSKPVTACQMLSSTIAIYLTLPPYAETLVRQMYKHYPSGRDMAAVHDICVHGRRLLTHFENYCHLLLLLILLSHR